MVGDFIGDKFPVTQSEEGKMTDNEKTTLAQIDKILRDVWYSGKNGSLNFFECLDKENWDSKIMAILKAADNPTLPPSFEIITPNNITGTGWRKAC